MFWRRSSNTPTLKEAPDSGGVPSAGPPRSIQVDVEVVLRRCFRIILERPQVVMMVDARRSVRIPVVPSDGLQAEVESAGETWRCSVSDLSRGAWA